MTKFKSNPGAGHWEGRQRILLHAYQSRVWDILFVGPKDYDPVINLGSWAGANSNTDPDMSLSVSGNITVMDAESKRAKGITGSLSE